MTVAYRTNSIKIPKTTTICVYAYAYIDIHNNIQKNTVHQIHARKRKGNSRIAKL